MYFKGKYSIKSVLTKVRQLLLLDAFEYPLNPDYLSFRIFRHDGSHLFSTYILYHQTQIRVL
jgi:hypothetical protein